MRDTPFLKKNIWLGEWPMPPQAARVIDRLRAWGIVPELTESGEGLRLPGLDAWPMEDSNVIRQWLLRAEPGWNKPRWKIVIQSLKSEGEAHV